MPEGPEIRTAADRIAKAIEKRELSRVWFAFDRLKRWEGRLRGRTVNEVETRGKAILVRMDGGLNIYSHNQLYGRWYTTRNGETPKTGRQLRLALHTPERSALLYSASEIEVLKDGDLEHHAYLSRLGPDVLDPELRPRLVQGRLQEPRFARRSLASLLLDQSFLCGVGNYLRSEILFVAGVDPARSPEKLEPEELRTLARAALTISRRAYRTKGVTNDPKQVRRLRARGVPRRDHRHFVFGRDGSDCYACGSTIDKIDAAGRRLYRCPCCQV